MLISVIRRGGIVTKLIRIVLLWLTIAAISGLVQPGSAVAQTITIDIPGYGLVTVPIGAYSQFLSGNVTSVNGVCGSGAGTPHTSAPATSGLCATGTASAVSGTGPWTWICTGANGGATAACSASLQAAAAASAASVSGACGTASGTTLASIPTANLCKSGIASTVTGVSSWTWNCSGSGGGTNAFCSASLVAATNGQCGAANGAPANSSPVSGLCSIGTASAVSGSAPWTWTCAGSVGGGSSASCRTAGACLGAPTAPMTAVILPPSVPQPLAANDIVGINLQNTTSAGLNPHVFTFGQIFKNGQVHATDTLVARVGDAVYQVQLDALANWPDGSVKLGAITLTTPNMCAGSTLALLLSKATNSDPTFSTAPVSLANAPLNLSVTLAFASGQYSGTQTIDLGTALKQSLTNNPSYWLSGPVARFI
jgi:hypothetical protein